jgi:hypothetical protein
LFPKESFVFGESVRSARHQAPSRRLLTTLVLASKQRPTQFPPKRRILSVGGRTFEQLPIPGSAVPQPALVGDMAKAVTAAAAVGASRLSNLAGIAAALRQRRTHRMTTMA